ncbi:MAG TPA: glycosyltransferase family 2 protein [Tepidisphaeraceae bacterium]|nr:glycosyltransferase family 2 protein [Tepidisphaeraceae bacterium]
MNATVVITTKNRKEDLRVAVRSALDQAAHPEVLVVDDGSTDGTADMIRSEFPTVRLERAEQSQGYIVQRNRGAELARGDVIFSIDDDAAFSTPHVVEQTLVEFNHPRVAAVAIPFINVNKENMLYQRAPGDDAARIYVNYEFIGTAHAVRRDIFLKLGGYREQLVHQGEERDYCVRLFDAGYIVRLGRSDPIHHFESPRRDYRRMDHFGRRNDVLYAIHNVPFPYWPAHAAMTTLKGLWFGVKVQRFWRMARGLASGWGALPREWRDRRPIAPSAYRLLRKLRRVHSLPLDEIESTLPPPRFG